jgi:hypothetical protein
MAFCFMIMPYGRRPTQVEPSSNAPGEVDFNALWDRAFTPAIQSLGYDPVRADQDTGALIINQMVERIYFADLVLADMTIPNGNVYYEVGVRQAAKRTGCVLLAADWSKQLFDAAQLRTVRYPLSDGDVGEPAAKAVISAITKEIEKRRDGVSPVHDSIKGYPDDVDEAAASTMKDVMAATAAFQGEIRAVRALPHTARMARAKELVAQYWRPPFPSDGARAPASHERQRGERGRLELDHRFHRQAPRRRRGAGGGSRAERFRACERGQANRRDRQARSADRSVRTDAGASWAPRRPLQAAVHGSDARREIAVPQ